MKKLFRLTWRCPKNEHLRKIWLTMKLTVVLFFLTISQMMASEAYSNTTGQASFLAQTGQKQKTITGKVSDTSGGPLPGVSVVVKGTTLGVITDTNGNFSLSNVPDGATIVFSFVGLNTQEVTVGTKSEFRIVMSESTIGVDEVIVIGYGTTTKKDFTGSVAQVKMENSPIANQPSMNALEAMKGSVAGLDIGAVNTAGGTPSIQIRGQKSISGSNSPLIVLDGVIYMGSLNQINPNDIASYDVLKDATSSAAYGSRSANGVIIITTKKGKLGKPMINFNASSGFQTWQTKPVMQTPEQYIQTVLDRNNTTDMSWMKDQLKANMAVGKVTDWIALSTRTGFIQDYQASISGASEKMSYYLSGAYSGSKGVVIGDDFNRSTILVKINADVTSWLQIGMDAAYTNAHFSGVRANLTTAQNLGPYSEPYRDNATQLLEKYPETQSQVNPLWDVLGDTRDNLDKRNNFRINTFALIKFPFLKGLTYRLNYAGTLSKDQTGAFINERSYVAEGNVTDLTRYSAATYKNLLSKANGNINNGTSNSWLIDNILAYKNTFGKHTVDLTAVATRDFSHSENENIIGSDFTANGNTLLGIYGLNKATTQKIDGGVTDRSNIGYFGRASYSYNEKYYLTTSYRRDGASVFGIDNKWGDFFAGGLAWKISNEAFYAPIKEIVNSLKIKLSSGMNGNQGLSPYGTLSPVASGSSGGIRYEYGTPTINYGMNVTALGNPGLGWEKTQSTNVGFESVWLNNRIFWDVDVYFTQTTNQLFTRSIPVMTGFATMQSSMGQVNNTGVEMTFSSINIKTKDLTWNSGLTTWMNRNKLVHLYGDDLNKDGKEDDDVGNSRFIGKPLGAIYGYRQDGIVQTSDTPYMTANGVAAGTPKYVDLDGDGKITSTDREILGYASPNFKINLSNTVTYKNFEFYMMISGVFGGGPGYYQAGNSTAFMAGGTGLFGSNSIYIPYWTTANPSNKYPSPTFAGDGRFLGLMSRDFIRIQDINLSYTFNQPWVKNAGIRNMKVFVSASNLATFTKWQGGDPEVGVTVRSNTMSALTSYSLGVNLSF
jgi:TonB-linked SusC/RagA family outer membrane protein